MCDKPIHPSRHVLRGDRKQAQPRHKPYHVDMHTKAEKRKFANNLKRHATRGEKSIRYWMLPIGYRFQAYDPTGYLPDFYNAAARVAIEVDGSVHRGEQKRHDKYKDRVRRKNHVYTVRVKDWWAYYLPFMVMIEALLTAIIYMGWTLARKGTRYIVTKIK